MDPETLQQWMKGGFYFIKCFQMGLFVVVIIMSASRTTESRFFILILLSTLAVLALHVLNMVVSFNPDFRIRFKRNVLEDEKYTFLWMFVGYIVVFVTILLYDHEKNTKVNGSTHQNISEPNQIPETIQQADSETFSYSVWRGSNTTEGSWKDAENFTNNVIKYEEDDLSYKNNKEGTKKPFFKPIYIPTCIVIAITVFFQFLAWGLAKKINFPVQDLEEENLQNDEEAANLQNDAEEANIQNDATAAAANLQNDAEEANIQNEAISMQFLASKNDNSRLVPNPNEGHSSPKHPLLPSIVPPRTHSASAANIYERQEDLIRLNYDSVSVTGQPISAADLRTLPLEREKFYPRNNLSSSAATSLIGDSLQRRSILTSSEFGSKDINPE